MGACVQTFGGSWLWWHGGDVNAEPELKFKVIRPTCFQAIFTETPISLCHFMTADSLPPHPTPPSSSIRLESILGNYQQWTWIPLASRIVLQYIHEHHHHLRLRNMQPIQAKILLSFIQVKSSKAQWNEITFLLNSWCNTHDRTDITVLQRELEQFT